MKSVIKALAATALVALSFTAAAQRPPENHQFQANGFEQTTISSMSCTGFYKTPSWKCNPINVPAYFLAAKSGDHRALVIVSPGAGGLDSRHSDYARQLAANGMNALVLDHWTARGMINAAGDYQKSRANGGDAVNYAIDVLAASSQYKAQAEWKETRLGYIGESMGGSAAINVTRPYIESIVADGMQRIVYNIDAIVSLYPGCIDRNSVERFKKVPMLIVAGEKDDQAPPSICEKQTEWMNERGGSVEFAVIAGAYHDWDAPYSLKPIPAENTSKCLNTRIGDKFVLESNGKEYAGTPEGFKAMREDCKSRGLMSGNQGDPRTGFDLWTTYLKKTLL